MVEAKVKAISAPFSPSSAFPAATKFTAKNVIKKVVLMLFIGASFSHPNRRSLSCSCFCSIEQCEAPGFSLALPESRQMIRWRNSMFPI
jgi:hypothetical protein